VSPRSRARARRLGGSALALLALLAARSAGAQEAASATARLEPALIGIGQVATLTLEAQSSGLEDLELEPQFSLENLEIVSGPMQSQSWQFVNGRASRSESLIWRVRATAVGSARISQISLKVNDALFELPDQVLEIQEEPVDSTDPNGRGRLPDPFAGSPFGMRPRARAAEAKPELFLRAEATPREPFVGQQVLYTLYLFTQADVGAINPEKVPGFEGFWVEDVPQPEKLQPEMVQIQGKRYGRVVLLRKALFPRSPGRFELEPVRARLVASMPEYSWLGSVIDRRREVFRTSNAVTIDVRPLPTSGEAPAGYRGAVGKLRLTTELEPTEVRLGEAATLTVTLEGQGNIQGVLEPELPVLEGVRAFPPEQSSRTRLSGTQVHGEKTWRYVLVPDRAGAWEVPPLAIDYFDPYEAEFRKAEAKPARLTALAPLEPIASVGAQETPTPVVLAESGETEAANSWLSDPRVVAGGTALALAALLLPAMRLLRNRSQSHKRLCARLRAASTIGHGRRAAAALEQAWREFLVDRFEIPAQSEAREWPQLLRSAGSKPAGVAEFDSLIEDLEYLHSAPELSASESLIAELVARSLKLARSLR